MPETTSAQSFYTQGQLNDAIAAATEAVRRSPSVIAERTTLCDLLSFTGDLERIEKQLDATAHLDPSYAVGVALYRQLLRGELARQQLLSDGRPPEFLSPPPEYIQLHLRATIALRSGDLGECQQLLQQAEAARPAISGACNGTAFEGLRDLDDLTASFFEVLSPTGKYYWVPMESVQSLELRPVKRYRDLVWRPARMTVVDGPDGEVYLPTRYLNSAVSSDDQVRLGRATNWQGEDGQPVLGQGLRMYLVGDQDLSIMQIQEITIQR